MSGTRTTLIVAAALAGAIVLGGCVSRGPVASPSATTIPSSTVTTATPPNSGATTSAASLDSTRSIKAQTKGPIYTPKSGSAERTALLDAARKKLTTKSQFTVYQLYVQGDTAIGEIKQITKDVNGHLLAVWERRNGKWVMLGAAKVGTASATAKNIGRALPKFSDALLASIVIATQTPKPPDSAGGASAATMIDTLSTAARTWSTTSMAGQGAPYKVTLAKVAKDANGVWWGHAVVQPTPDASNNFEALNFWAKYSSGSWEGKQQDPEPPAPSTYFPSSVIKQLGL
jgi:hypothetical protein